VRQPAVCLSDALTTTHPTTEFLSIGSCELKNVKGYDCGTMMKVKWRRLTECKRNKYHLTWRTNYLRPMCSYRTCGHNILSALRDRHRPYVDGGLMHAMFPDDDMAEVCRAASLDTTKYLALFDRLEPAWRYLRSKCEWLGDLDEYVCNVLQLVGKSQKWSLQQVLESKPPNKFKRYERAKEWLRCHTISEKHRKVKVHVKNERMASDVYKPPRLIQARSPEFTMLLQQYLKPMEEFMRDDLDKCVNKGMNLDQTYDLLQSICGPDLYYLLMDHDAFDASVNIFLLLVEHLIYLESYNHDYTLADLLRSQIYNRCVSIDGTVKWWVVATRMSGDGNTAHGNSVVNLFWLQMLFGSLQHRDVVCGDDSVVAARCVDKITIDGRLNSLQGLLFNTKGKSCTSFEDIEFCQCLPNIYVRSMVKDALRTVSRSAICINPRVKDVNDLIYWKAAFARSNRHLAVVGMNKYMSQFEGIDEWDEWSYSDRVTNISSRITRSDYTHQGYTGDIIQHMNEIIIPSVLDDMLTVTIDYTERFKSMV